MNVEELIRDIESGHLTREARLCLQAELKRKGDRAYKLLNAMYLRVKSPYDKATKTIIETLLAEKADPMLAGLALKLLISWGLYKEYKCNILEALNGTTWDKDCYFKLEGVHSAGLYLREALDVEVLSAVLKRLLDNNELSGTRLAARDALLCAMGCNPKEVVENSIDLHYDYKPDQDFVVKWAQDKLI